ncbi:MAG TPA: 2-phospho-L-lactate transferase [Myxococcota bacterium]
MSAGGPARPIAVLAGGVGAARFLAGLVRAVPPEQVVAVVNTGDDRTFYGLHVSPDLDIVTYTLAGRVDPEKGYGLAGDTFAVLEALAALGHATWFRLGDRDLATALHRTNRLREGAGLAAVADEVRRAYRVEVRILPMSEEPCPTYVELRGGRRLHFEEYLARDGAPDEVEHVDLAAARAARPAPGVLAALRGARRILVAPSNPVVSIGPIVAVPGVREAIAASGAPVVAVSPIVGGRPVKGPADKLLRGVGAEVSARGVAALYRDWVHGFVLDACDAAQAADVEALGLRTRVVDTIMRDAQAAARLAREALALADAIAATAGAPARGA